MALLTKSSSQASSRERGGGHHLATTTWASFARERSVDLGKRRVELAFADVSAHIEPETVQIKSLTDPAGLSVLEQNYRRTTS